MLHWKTLYESLWVWDAFEPWLLPGSDIKEWGRLWVADWDEVDRIYTDSETKGA